MDNLKLTKRLVMNQEAVKPIIILSALRKAGVTKIRL